MREMKRDEERMKVTVLFRNAYGAIYTMYNTMKRIQRKQRSLFYEKKHVYKDSDGMGGASGYFAFSGLSL